MTRRKPAPTAAPVTGDLAGRAPPHRGGRRRDERRGPGSPAERGARVSGTDSHDSAALARLRALGLDVTVGHDPARVPPEATVVVSTAVKEDNPEAGRGSRPRPGGGPPVPGPGTGCRGTRVRGGGRSPRQDDDLRDAGRGAHRDGCGPLLRHRGRGARVAYRRPPRYGTGLRGRGGRVRPLLPQLHAQGRGGHQRRAGPPRHLRHPRRPSTPPSWLRPLPRPLGTPRGLRRRPRLATPGPSCRRRRPARGHLRHGGRGGPARWAPGGGGPRPGPRGGASQRRQRRGGAPHHGAGTGLARDAEAGGPG